MCLQLLLGILGFVCLILVDQAEFAYALLYGVTLMVVNMALHARRLSKAAGLNADVSRHSFYQDAAIRFAGLLLGLLLAVFLNLHLLIVAGGIFLAQTVFFVCALFGFTKYQKEIEGDEFD